MNNRIRKAMELAISQARKFQHDGPHHHCAVLFNDGFVKSIGFNYRTKTHTKSTHPFHRIHAEMDCILGNDSKILEGGILCVARVGFINRAEVLMSRPCEWCRLFIARTKIREVWYTIANSEIGWWNVTTGEESVEYEWMKD